MYFYILGRETNTSGWENLGRVQAQSPDAAPEALARKRAEGRAFRDIEVERKMIRGWSELKAVRVALDEDGNPDEEWLDSGDHYVAENL